MKSPVAGETLGAPQVTLYIAFRRGLAMNDMACPMGNQARWRIKTVHG
jgi:hypothetical protein